MEGKRPLRLWIYSNVRKGTNFWETDKTRRWVGGKSEGDGIN